MTKKRKEPIQMDSKPKTEGRSDELHLFYGATTLGSILREARANPEMAGVLNEIAAERAAKKGKEQSDAGGEK